jgi:hypothetical protein
MINHDHDGDDDGGGGGGGILTIVDILQPIRILVTIRILNNY